MPWIQEMTHLGDGQYGMSDRWVDDAMYARDQAAAAALPSQQALYYQQMGLDPNDPRLKGVQTNYGEGVTGTTGGLTFSNSQYGPTATLDLPGFDGNRYWNGSSWVKVPETTRGHLESFMDVAPVVLAVAGGVIGAGGFMSAPLSETAAMSQWAGLPAADTGGMFVGSNGLIGSTGNAIGDSILNSAAQGGLKSAVTGGDPVEGALTGAAGGLISSSGVLKPVADAITPEGASSITSNAISRGVNAAGTSLATTGDLEAAAGAGVASGVGNYVGGTVAGEGATRTVSGAAGGAAAGLASGLISGSNIGDAILTGAAAGGAGGLASDLGASNTVASGVGSIVGGVVGSGLADDPTPAGGAAPGTGFAGGVAAGTGSNGFEGMTFGSLVKPEFVDVTRSTEWGSRLSGIRRT